jgi:hypothetical protein
MDLSRICGLRAKPCEGDPWLMIAWDWGIEGSELLRGEGVDAAIVSGVVPLRFKPKVAVNHGITLRPGRLYFWAARALYRGYDRLVCVSKRLRCEVRSVLGVDCEVVPLPLKLNLYGPGPEERENLIVHVGTRPVKNPWGQRGGCGDPEEEGLRRQARGRGPAQRGHRE